jgi:hypothetical protein
MKKINDGHYLELMDRLYVKLSEIEDHLLHHPLTPKLKKVKKLINKSGMALSEAYQIVGHELYKKQEKNEPIKEVIFRRHKNTKN